MENDTQTFREQFLDAAKQEVKNNPKDEGAKLSVEKANALVEKEREDVHTPKPLKNITPSDAIREAQTSRDEQKKELHDQIRATVRGEELPTRQALPGAKSIFDITDTDKQRPSFKVKELQNVYHKIDPEVRDFIDKLESEKAQLPEKSYLNDVDKVLEPYMPELNRLGAKPVQLVARLLQYRNALSNDQTKYQALAELANDFKIDLSVFNNARQEQSSNLSPALQGKLAQVEHLFKAHNQQRIQAKAAEYAPAADKEVSELKQRAPHYERLKVDMANVMVQDAASGLNRFRDHTGKVNLPGIYEYLCWANKLEPYPAKQEDPKQVAPKPVAKPQKPQRQSNSSVRESLRAAFAEHRV
jgi:hypothetical protein